MFGCDSGVAARTFICVGVFNLLMGFMANKPPCASCVGVCMQNCPSLFGGLAGGGRRSMQRCEYADLGLHWHKLSAYRRSASAKTSVITVGTPSVVLMVTASEGCAYGQAVPFPRQKTIFLFCRASRPSLELTRPSYTAVPGLRQSVP
jgi:hypothetical protein